jgi:hypothetical protein
MREYENPQVKDTYEPLICAEATVNCVDKTFSIGLGSMPDSVNS